MSKSGKERTMTTAPAAAKARLVVGEIRSEKDEINQKKRRKTKQQAQARTKAAAPKQPATAKSTASRNRTQVTRRRDFKRGEVYHLYQRGNYKKKVFHSWMQTAKYRNRLFYLALRYKVRIHTFCLMANHIHLVLEPTTKLGIGLLMRDLQSGHAQMVNTWMGIRGNLWQQNYRAKHIDSSAYYRTVIHYVETNPVRAGSVKKAEEYWWSGALAHVAKGPVTYEWLYPEGFGSKTHRWDRCVVKLHLDRWRKEFGEQIDWSAYLANPYARPLAQDAEQALEHAQAQATLDEFLETANATREFELAKTKRTNLRKGKGGNQFVNRKRLNKPPIATTSLGPPSLRKKVKLFHA